MNVAAIIYHKNILSIYDRKWIDDCMNSIKNQTFSDFSIFELNYGDDDLNLCKEYDIKNEYHYYKRKFDNHAEAMNFLLSKCRLNEMDAVFNNNLDDYNDEKRFEIQLEKIKEGYDLVSSNFYIIDGDKERISMWMSAHDPSIELEKEHNIICHPSVCYSKKFLQRNRYKGGEIPKEDLKLWKRTVNKYKFYICPEFLVNYRKHENQITTTHSKKIKKKEKPVENKIEDKIEDKVQIQVPIQVTFPVMNNINVCRCGEPINKIKYNYCPRCSRLY